MASRPPVNEVAECSLKIFGGFSLKVTHVSAVQKRLQLVVAAVITAFVDANNASLFAMSYLKNTLNLLVSAGTILITTTAAFSANVPPSGYTNSFGTQPPAADWATLNRAGSGTDTYDLDAEVNATVTAAGVTAQTSPNTGDPPAALATATWSSAGLYLQTRPTGNRYTLLVGKFINATGTNATQVAVSFKFTTTESTAVEEEGKGIRVYYSEGGETNSWINLPSFNFVSSAATTLNLATNVAVNWTNGGSLYVLWADDNGSVGTDSGNQIDDFALQVMAGSPPALDCALASPTNNAVLPSGTPVTASATVSAGIPPYAVEFYMSSGAGSTAFELVGLSGAAPFNADLGALAAGTYNLFAAATDNSGTPGAAYSKTNTFFVVNPIALSLTAPANNATIDHLTAVTASASVVGGTAPYSVQFYLDNAAIGTPLKSPPFSRNLGTLFVGDHTIRATVTDARGWVSNSAVHTVHITGPLGVVSTPTNGAVFRYGQAVTLQAQPGGGTGPYRVDFFLNEQAAGSRTSAPFSVELGMLPAGSYTSRVQVTDSAIPAQQVNSGNSIFTVEPNPLVISLSSPTAGQTVTAGTPLTLAAAATVLAPVVVSNVQFFYNGTAVGTDSSAPYSATVTPTEGSHSVYALASDSLGRKVYSVTNRFSATLPVGGNDNFANAYTLVGPVVTTTANNQNAGREFREPRIAGNGGGASLWWNWTPTASGPTTIDTQGSDINTLLGVFTGDALNTLTRVVDNNDYSGNTWSRVEFNAVAGTVYRIVVDGFSAGFGSPPARGNIVLNIKGVGGLSLVTPTNGMVFTLGDPITVTAVTDSNFPNPPAARVDFYRNGTLFASQTTAPFTVTATTVPAGTNTFYALATDSLGLPVQSGAVSVFVQTIGVTLLSPVEDTMFGNTSPITVTAWAYIPSGSITNVEFYVDGVRFGEDATAPFSAVWNNVTGGSHRLTAIGRATTGASYVSAPVNIGVASTLLSFASTWKYLDDGSDQGTNWIMSGFDDSAWVSGPAPLGYSDSNGRVPATTVSFGPEANNKYPTTYFRQAVMIGEVADFQGITLSIERDDGAIVYLNGQELARYNMPAGPVTYTTYAAGNAGDDGGTIFNTSVPASAFVPGTNVFAVEIHQDSGTSSDIWFQMQLVGLPVIQHNQLPTVALNSPANNQSFLAPASITLSATAEDPDGSVAKVEFYADGAKVGESTTAPFMVVWSNPAQGPHTLVAVATDNQQARQESSSVHIDVYDSIGTPFARLTSPPDGLNVEGGTNLFVEAYANAALGVTRVQFLANGAAIGEDTTSPYSMVWNANFGTNLLTAVVTDTAGKFGTSAPVRLIAYPNTTAPTVASQTPPAGAVITNLTSVRVVFTEPVQNVDAADLLVNGVPASAISGSGTTYTFTVNQPAYGTVTIGWAATHGIMDFGYPSNLPFNSTGPGATWTLNLVDQTPPVIVNRIPAAGTVVTNLTQVEVTFSEAVQGVNAADLLVNGAGADGVAGSGSNYTFSFVQPTAGLVNISWVNSPGILDLAGNAFNGAGPGAAWSYTLDPRVALVQSNSTWLFIKGTAEASTPIEAWRQLAFDDSGWSNAPAPFYFGDPYGNGLPASTLLSDMQGNYSTIYLRKKFNLVGAHAVTNLYLTAQCDDGFVAWINGIEVLRFNAPAGEVPYNGLASATAQEPQNNGAPYISYVLENASSYLVDGENIIAVHALNQSLAQSSDFGINLQLSAILADPAVIPPSIATVTPQPGSLFYLTNITVRFTEPVQGVSAADLLVNGVPAAGITSTTNTTYTFSFPQPAFGPVAITWAAAHGIQDFDAPPKAFNGTGFGASFNYSLVNPSAPTVAMQSPAAGATVSTLTQVNVSFTEGVTGVDASDLQVNGVPAIFVSGGPVNYVFTFPQPAYGSVAITWAASTGITDTEPERNAFDGTRAGNIWSYTLEDLTPPSVVSQIPAGGSQVTNLTQLTVVFTEPVTGVNASDLWINGAPAATVTGAGTTYTFSFAQPNATLVNVTWAPAHGIRDLAVTPNPFNGAGPGATWVYSTPDNVAPGLASLTPPAGGTVRSLLQITVTFTEAVTGIHTNDLLMNNVPARQVSGSGAGPYTFGFQQPSNGVVQVRWSGSHGITDLATPANPFPGGNWSYLVDPNASFVNKIIVNELMFNPLWGVAEEEWIELHNLSSDVVNLAGWRITRGVDYTFPTVSIPAGDYLVVAADVASFQRKYPGVSNVVGGWTGRLANNGETIEIATAEGEVVSRMQYAAEGDWARRERGHDAAAVTSITRNGNIATVDLFGHNFTSNDRVMITGADQPEYNGIFVVTSPSSATFNITVNGTPVTPAAGRILCRLVVDNGASGWSWFSAADGLGSSMELINPTLPNNLGQSWLTSIVPEGTPGRANSVFAATVAPYIQDVTHFPAVPRSTESVTISARISDPRSNAVQSVTLHYRNHSTTTPPPFSTVPMFDDGAHNDGAAQDGLYAATLAPQPNRNVMEFYVEALGSGGLTRTWPAATWETNNTFAQLANALYQVDDEPSATNMPFLRVILTESERSQLNGIDTASDAEMNATFVSVDGDGTKVRYASSIRLRGAGSRGGTPKNFRVNVPGDNPWNGRKRMNLNSRYVHAQLAGSVLAQRAGLSSADARVVQVRINGQNLASGISFGCYVLLEPMNGDWAANHFPRDPDGNVYRGSKFPWNANLDHLGTNAAIYQGQTGAGYYKTSNREENDWTDLFRLTQTLSSSTPEVDYVTAVRTNLNVDAALLYFVVCNFFDYQETSLCNGVGDDYAMYRGLVDPRFRFVAHDFDTILGQGDTGGSTTRSIWNMVDSPRSTDPSQRANFLPRFMRHPEFAPIYFRLWKQHLEATFSPGEVSSLLDQVLGGWVSTDTLTSMKTFAANRRTYVLGQIPTNLTINSTLPTQNGYLYTTTPTATLNGQSDIINTRRVLVNGNPANWVAWQGRWTNAVTLQPGINRVLVQSMDSNSLEIARATLDIWYDDASLQNVSGALSSDIVWNAAGGPYNVTGNVTVNSGVTLTIQPGTTVYFGGGVNLTVANGGTLIATGTPNSTIRFTRAPGSATTWGGIDITGGANSPESRIAYTHIDGNGATAIHSTDGTVFLDHVSFGNTAAQYLSLDRSSFVVQDCVFPAITGSFEPVHGSGGIKAGGRGIFLRNFFGRISGYNDTIDFSGGHRPGPIVQFINNVFMGSGDDNLDLDNTDAWVEGNIFLHVHKNGSPDTSSAVSGGSDTGESSDVTIIGNIFYDVDHAALAKQGNYFTFFNNTVVRQNHSGGLDTTGAIVCLADNGMAEGAGAYFEGNILYDIENLTRERTNAIVTFTNNFMPLSWTGPGGNNSSADPLLTYVPQLAETTNFTSWAEAQVIKEWFSLRQGSPASGSGPNGQDAGGVIPRGVSLSGTPAGRTPLTSATFTFGLNRNGSGMTATRWPNGSGYTHYRWRLDAGVWSAETPLNTPITINNLSSGPHFIEVTGKSDAAFYQDDPVFGPDAAVTLSATWIVDPAASALQLSEVLASNSGVVRYGNTTPDLIELYNASDAIQPLTGVRLTDDAMDPDKFIFPAGAVIGPRQYLVLYANNPDGSPGYHLGFNLREGGETVYLYDAASRGGALLDSVSFGLQVTDLSIGRLADGTWELNVPTFGGANKAAPLGSGDTLRINEWLALGVTPFASDFIELFNPGTAAVSLGGLFLSDEILGWRNRQELPALSYIAGNGYVRFFGDGDTSQGPEHLNFGLSGDQGTIGLYREDLTPIDQVTYLAQRANVSQGRSPNGAGTIVFFEQPTPGAPNPLISGPTPNGGVLVINEVLANNASLLVSGRTSDWIELYNGTTTNVTLAGLSLSDDPLQPRRFVFGAGTTLAPGAWMRVICDTGATNTGSLVNTNFALRSSGGGVYLFDTPANGGSLLSAVTYGLQVADLSIGRVSDGSTNWALCHPSPGSANLAVASLADPSGLVINEWLANPRPGDDDWFEVYNRDAQPVALGGLFLTDDLNTRTKHRIAPLSFLGSGTNAWQRFMADGNTGAGANHVSFNLRAAGEALGISSTNGTLINGLVFGEQTEGVSDGRFPDGGTNIVAFPGTASPGESNWRRLPNVVINEVLTHTDEPLEDAIELHNLTAQEVDVGGWWLSDDAGTLQKYQIPSPRRIPPFGFTVIYENVFTNRETAAVPFAISSRGDEVVLSAYANNAFTGWRTKVDFGAAANGVSFGRYVTSDAREEFVPLSSHTFGVSDPGGVAEFRTGTGASNTYPRMGPVVISEVMYRPPDAGTNDNTRDEFIELRNITTAPVVLSEGTNSWRLRNAVDFDFPVGTLVQPGDYLLVVGFDPVNNPMALQNFRALYHVDPGVTIVGPWAGKLANDTDDIELRRPDVPDTNGVAYLLVERVRYFDVAPWPSGADGTGNSLHRLDDSAFGNDPDNWTASTPTPGPQAAPSDTDEDGIPDSWETLYALDPFNPGDAQLDTDGDGLSNLQEYQLGTNPRDPASGLKLTIVPGLSGTNIVLSFTAAPGYEYFLDYTDKLGAQWTTLQVFGPVAANQVISVSVPKTQQLGFFRLRVQTGTPGNSLRLESVRPLAVDQVRLVLSVPANQPCTILFTPALGQAWGPIRTYPAAATNQLIQADLPANGSNGFFRLQSP